MYFVQRVQRTILLPAIVLTLCLISVGKTAPAAEQIDQSNLPEWAGGWTHVNPTGEGQAVMWQTFTPGRPNLTAVEIDVLTANPGQGDDVLTVEIARDGAVLASAERSVEDGFDGLLRFDFPQAVPLVPGQIYELTVRDTGKTRFGWKYGSNTYERGSRYVFAQQRPGSDWFFRTYAGVEPAAAKYSGGTGEPNDPYQIATAADLIALGETPEDYDKHFILTADIDLDPNLPGRKVFDRAVIAPDTDSNDQWALFQGPAFTGVFEGNGYTISHLTIMGGSYLGLFGQLGDGYNGEVRNVGLVDVNSIATGDDVGGLVGLSCWGSSIANSYSTGSVNGTDRVGGLVGNNGGTITASYSSGSVRGTGVGGLVGLNQGTYYWWGEGSITSSYSSASVSGTGDCVGGLVGQNGGSPFGGGSITSSYSSGSVNGTGNCVGGLVGLSGSGSIVSSYSTGLVTGEEYVGGLVGYNNHGVISSSFWDSQTSGQVTSNGGTGKTTAEMQMGETFLEAGWDFVGEAANGTEDIWWIDEGKDYPRLWWELEETGL